jgi:MFS superfamily sulfate permease-like transporter
MKKGRYVRMSPTKLAVMQAANEQLPYSEAAIIVVACIVSALVILAVLIAILIKAHRILHDATHPTQIAARKSHKDNNQRRRKTDYEHR